MKAENRFWSHLRNYFTVYLPKQRNASPNTITSARQTWNLLLRYMANTSGRKLADITMETIDVVTVIRFLDHMEQVKGWQPSTRNHRLSMIRSFFAYAACMEPVCHMYVSQLAVIPLKKGINKSFVLDYMSEVAMKEILKARTFLKRIGSVTSFFSPSCMILPHGTVRCLP